MSRKKNLPTIRSSAAEYLTFIAATGQGGVEAVYADEDVWLSQKMMGELYGVNVRTVSEHLKNIFSDQELEQEAVIRNFRITASSANSPSLKTLRMCSETVRKSLSNNVTICAWDNQTVSSSNRTSSSGMPSGSL